MKYIMPFYIEKEDFSVSFLNSKDTKTVTINAKSDDSKYTFDIDCMLVNKTNKDLIMNADNAFYLKYCVYDDTNENEKIDVGEIKYNDSIYLDRTPVSKFYFLKKEEPNLISLKATTDLKKYQELIYVIKNTTGHSIEIKLKAIDNKIYSVYDGKAIVIINNKEIKY